LTHLQQLAERLCVGIDRLRRPKLRAGVVDALGLALLRHLARSVDESANILARLRERMILSEELETELTTRGGLVERQKQGMVRNFQVALSDCTLRSHALDALQAMAPSSQLQLQPAKVGEEGSLFGQQFIDRHHGAWDLLLDDLRLPQHDLVHLLAGDGHGEGRTVTFRSLLAAEILESLHQQFQLCNGRCSLAT
jgi:hypothetical protein